MTLERIKYLASDAYAVDDFDWGSERQIDTENAFFAECEKIMPEILDTDTNYSFQLFALRATSGERIDEALRIVREHFGGLSKA